MTRYVILGDTLYKIKGKDEIQCYSKIMNETRKTVQLMTENDWNNLRSTLSLNGMIPKITKEL